MIQRKVSFYESLERAQKHSHSAIQLQKLGIRDADEVARILSDPIVKEAHDSHMESVRVVTECVHSRVPEYRIVENIDHSHGDWADLIVSVGGDGTFLKASHAIKSDSTVPIVGINSSPQSSFGFYCAALKESWPEMLDDIISGKRRPSLVYRMDVFINSVRYPIPVLNDVLFAGKLSADTVRYNLQFGSTCQSQKSSGIWVSTAAGSTAAMLSAGGKEQDITSRSLQFRVRELFPPSVKNLIPISGGIVSDEIRIISRMPNSRLFLDGAKLSIPIRFGDQVVLKPSIVPLSWYSSELCVIHREQLRQENGLFKKRLETYPMHHLLDSEFTSKD